MRSLRVNIDFFLQKGRFSRIFIVQVGIYGAAQQYLEQDRENLAPLTVRTYFGNHPHYPGDSSASHQQAAETP